MRFAAIALRAVPDIATAGRWCELGDPDPKVMSKVLHHKRKQRSGEGQLPVVEQCVAAVSYGGYSGGAMSMWKRSTIEHPEQRVPDTWQAA